ncbi:calcium-binding protein [Planoprotostelium fungivorum]|uniref:Calcium-binding protein n=1 Tax=Planoprotostelium fungivorum TaxID=1890364 RepID=A0A2P6N338_9EUKA|nr:calcium-binding protein [Planoprotostelium fungivorum]
MQPPAGYPPQQGGYPPQGQPGGYPPQQGGYPPQGQPGGYPPQQGYPPQGQPGYPPQQGYPPQGQPGGYPPQGQPGYPPQQGKPGQPGQPGYPPQQGYPPQGQPGQAGGYPPQGQPGQPGGYPPQGQAGGYPPQGQPGQAGGYPPQGQPGQAGGYPPQGQPGQPGAYPPQGQAVGYPPQGQPGQPGQPTAQKGYPPQGQPGYPPQGQPGGYPPQQGYPPQGQPGYPPQQGYPPQGQPSGYPPQQPGYPPQGYPPQAGYATQTTKTTTTTGYPPQPGYPPQGYPPQAYGAPYGAPAYPAAAAAVTYVTVPQTYARQSYTYASPYSARAAFICPTGLPPHLAAKMMQASSIFRMYDTNRSGSLSKKEWKKAMSHMGYHMHKHDRKRLFHMIDRDHSGYISERGERYRPLSLTPIRVLSIFVKEIPQTRGHWPRVLTLTGSEPKGGEKYRQRGPTFQVAMVASSHQERQAANSIGSGDVGGAQRKGHLTDSFRCGMKPPSVVAVESPSKRENERENQVSGGLVLKASERELSIKGEQKASIAWVQAYTRGNSI